jgi:hypothetical protein
MSDVRMIGGRPSSGVMNRGEGWEPYPGAASSPQGIAEGAIECPTFGSS